MTFRRASSFSRDTYAIAGVTPNYSLQHKHQKAEETMIQVARQGSHFTVLVDGVSYGTFYTRHAAVQKAIELRQETNPVQL